MRIDNPSRLSDAALITEAARLALCERDATVELIAHLAELEDRQLHRRAGYSTLFPYCTEVLRLSEHAAYNRITAARAVRAFPLVLPMLLEGALTLTTVRLLAPHLTSDNSHGMLAAAAGRSKRQVEEMLAPRGARAGRETAAIRMAAATAPAPDTRGVVVPFAPDRFRFAFTADRETRELLELARNMLGHAVPSGDTGEIVRRALRALIDGLSRKIAATPRPHGRKGTVPPGRYLSADGKRAVWVRDRQDGRGHSFPNEWLTGGCYDPPDGDMDRDLSDPP